MARGQLSPHLNNISGKLGNVVFRSTVNGTVIANPPPLPKGPASPDQAIARRFMSTSGRVWSTLPDSQRAPWEKRAPEVGVKTGQVLFNQASFYRQAAGLPLPETAPAPPPHVALMALQIAPAEAPGTLRIVFEHPIEELAGWRIFVQTTRNIPSLARKPQNTDFRAVSSLGPASIPELQPSGAVYLFENLRFDLLPGARFGIRVTLITPDGLPAGVLQTVLIQPE